MQMSQLPLDLLRIIAHFLSDIKERNGEFITTMRKDEEKYKNLFNNFRYRVMINSHEILNSKRFSPFPAKFDTIYFRQLSKLNLNISEEAMEIYNNNIIEFLSDFDRHMKKRFEKGHSIQMFILSIHNI